MSASKGRHIWYDLMSNDVEASKAFYTETIGLKSKLWEENQGPAPYTMWMVGERPIGGLMTLPEEAKKMGAPPHWLAHIVTDDVDATAKKAESLGGTILNTVDVPNVGRFAVLRDPQGAVFAAFKPEGDMPLNDGDPEVGDVSWNELNTTDWEGASKFYSELFGWKKTDTMDMGEMGTYWMFQRSDADGSMGGMSNMAKTQNIPPHWLYYFHVDNIDAAVERIKSKGGKLLNGPMEVPGGDKVAQFQDPQGIAFAIHAKA